MRHAFLSFLKLFLINVLTTGNGFIIYNTAAMIALTNSKGLNND